MIRNESLEATIEAKRKQLLDLIREMVPRVENTLTRFNQAFPVQTAHVERTAVESDRQPA
jgi:hypothetical protein